MTNKPTFLDFENHEALVDNFAAAIIERLSAAIEADGKASIAFSGGSTPKKLFVQLSKADFDWSKVDITLVDERCVEQTDDRSNAKLLKDNFLSTLSTQPNFVALYPQDAKALDDLKKPFDICILGMGGDGHTASFFPDSDNLADMLDMGQAGQLKETQSESSIEVRSTWNLPLLLQSKWLVLHMVGADKIEVYEEALKSEDAMVLPIRSAIHQDASPLTVYYSAVK